MTVIFEIHTVIVANPNYKFNFEIEILLETEMSKRTNT